MHRIDVGQQRDAQAGPRDGLGSAEGGGLAVRELARGLALGGCPSCKPQSENCEHDPPHRRCTSVTGSRPGMPEALLQRT